MSTDEKSATKTAKDARTDVRTAGGRRCPICGKPVAAQDYRPFCSKRCADVDLGNWLGERYAVPAVEPPDGFDPEAAEDEDYR